jgi:hypothetical protein
MSVTIVNVADLRDPDDPQGRTYRQVNAARTHAISIGALVELDSGERLFVKKHTRDCDQTPLYSLGMFDDEEDDEIAVMKWQHGYGEESLTVVAAQGKPADEVKP